MQVADSFNSAARWSRVSLSSNVVVVVNYAYLEGHLEVFYLFLVQNVMLGL
jgi:hypothetical protein